MYEKSLICQEYLNLPQKIAIKLAAILAASLLKLVCNIKK